MPSQNEIEIFDRNLQRTRLQRAAKTFKDFDFLMSWGENQILDRLTLITKKFKNTLVIGSRVSQNFLSSINAKNITHMADINIADAPDDFTRGNLEAIPFKSDSFDLIIINLELHHVNDLPGCLIQLKNALKPDGLLVASMFGGETLQALRQSLMEAELKIKGGISPRVHPFADKQDMGALLQRAGFNLPVVDSDFVTVTYDHMFKLMHDLRGMGENNIIRDRQKTFSRRALFLEAARYYQENFAESDERIPARFEVIFLHGWKPHESQQKPLKPGSGETHLSDVL